MTVYIKRFDVSKIKQDRVFLFVGKRGTGKSTLIRDIMSHIRGYIDLPLAMTPTEESATMFGQCMPKSCVYNDYSVDTIRNVIDCQRKNARKKQEQHVLVVLDDMMFDKKVLKSVEMRDIFMNGRHLKITFINAMQYVMDMGPDLRTQVDYVFALRENILNNMIKLWKYFFGMFSKFEDFRTTFSALTEHNGCIVIDNTAKTNTIEDTIFWYKADLNIQPYRLGRSRYWTLDAQYYRNEDEIARDESSGGGGVPRSGRILTVEKTDPSHAADD